jgi:hypothetical protein
MTKDRIFEIRCCWLLPSGEILVVPQEEHEDNLPDAYDTMERAENACVKFCCTWGYNAPISNIFLPVIITSYQAQALIRINDYVKKYYGYELKLFWDYSYSNWNDIQDLI